MSLIKVAPQRWIPSHCRLVCHGHSPSCTSVPPTILRLCPGVLFLRVPQPAEERMHLLAIVFTYQTVLCMLSHVLLFATPWAVAHQAPPSMGFPRQEYWCGLPCLPPGIFLTQGANVQLHFLCLFHSRQIVYALSHVETVNFGGELYRKPKCCRMSGGGVP